jgi:hypothetical protein
LIVIILCGAAGPSSDQKSTSLAGITTLNLTDSRDTGYRSVADGQDEDTVPRCPAFKNIGQKYGPFDLARFVQLFLKAEL